MTTSDDDWVNGALTDDSLAATMLLRLRAAASPEIRLRWTVRRRRSRSAARHRAGEKADIRRASPKTPLSWSGATSLSGGAADGFEESSRLDWPLRPSRSKIIAYTSEATTNKRPRKKTLAELKDEESLLLKERRSLKKELATLLLKLESQRAKNESLKKMEVYFQPSTLARFERGEQSVLNSFKSSRRRGKGSTEDISLARALLDHRFSEEIDFEKQASKAVLGMQSRNKTFKTTLISSVASEETISDRSMHVEAINVTATSNYSAHQFLSSCSSKVQELGIRHACFLVPDLNAPIDERVVSSIKQMRQLL